MKRIFAEPLVHFLLLGVVMFAAYSQVSTFTGDEPGKNRRHARTSRVDGVGLQPAVATPAYA